MLATKFLLSVAVLMTNQIGWLPTASAIVFILLLWTCLKSPKSNASTNAI